MLVWQRVTGEATRFRSLKQLVVFMVDVLCNRPAAELRHRESEATSSPEETSSTRPRTVRLADLLACFTEGFETADLREARRLVAH